MSSTYLSAELYGIGQLISQLKRFRVPAHQRDYSWTKAEVSQFASDVLDAMDSGAGDYFVGLVVLLTDESENGLWEVLDGQQRLATTSILLASIRDWLSQNGFIDDAAQIDSDFLAVRRLGGAISSRMTLNDANQPAFSQFVVSQAGDDQIREARERFGKGSSNRLLVDAVVHCRKFVSETARSAGERLEQQADKLFRLASYIESGVRVVTLKLGNADDAYVVFESLNYRGHELSALDLVKNHIFSLTPRTSSAVVNDYWQMLTDYVDASNADDFLRLFWISQFGRVQRRHLFRSIRDKYKSPELAIRLAQELAFSGRMYAALEDAESDVWAPFSLRVRERVGDLIVLRARQSRAVVFAGFGALGPNEFESMLGVLGTVTVRYQTVGKRRTGALEIACADAAYMLRENAGFFHVADMLLGICPSDGEFHTDFLSHVEHSASKAAYLLRQLELTYRQSMGITAHEFQLKDAIAIPLLSEKDIAEAALPKNWIGNWILIEPELAEELLTTNDSVVKEALIAKSGIQLTSRLSTERGISAIRLVARGDLLADIAVAAWPKAVQ